jgi:hypothetical protein
LADFQHLIDHWTTMAQALVGSVGAFAFALAFLWKIVAVDSRSVMEAKRWIGRIAFGTIGVELASEIVKVLTSAAHI